MANNPYINKVEFDGQTLMDLTGDTVTPTDVLNGVSFHDRSGAAQQGSLITHNVYDGLDSTSTSDALSAKQGKVLNDGLSGKVNTSAIKNNLTTTSSGYVLDARQGKALNDSISNITVSRRAAGTYTSSECPAFGFITSSAKDAIVFIPMIWHNPVSTVSITKVLASLRTTDGGYLGGSSNVNLTSYVVNDYYLYKASASLRFILRNSNGWGVTNNTPFCGIVTLDYTVT